MLTLKLPTGISVKYSNMPEADAITGVLTLFPALLGRTTLVLRREL